MSDLKGKQKELNEILEELMGQTPQQMVSDWVDNCLRAKEDPVTLGFPSLDEIFEGDLRGKLCAIAHYGGTKKSLLALNTINANKKAKAYYSSMEMNSNNFLSRLLNIFSPNEDETRYHFAKYIKNILTPQNRINIINEVSQKLNDYYDDRLLINCRPRLETKDYKLVLENDPSIQMLVVDGLSRMGGTGTETEIYSDNSGALKDLANEHNVFATMICHCSKGARKDTRDVQQFVRGSEKILDNCDFILMPSLIQDDSNPGQWRTDIGFLRCIDKRNTGIVKDLIYKFDEYKLTFEESDIDPSQYADNM